MINSVDPAVCATVISDFIWDFRKLPSHLGKYIIKIGKISTKIHETGKVKAIFELRNRFALAVICCLIYHWLEVSR